MTPEELRDMFATAALQGMCSPLDDGGVYPPMYTDEDYKPSPEGDSHEIVYYQAKDGNWRAELREDVKPRFTPHQLCVSYEHAIARSAYRFADAMLLASAANTQEKKEVGK